MEYTAFLADTFLFKGFPEAERKRALAHLSVCVKGYRRGETVQSAGEPLSSLTFLQSGTAAVYRDAGHAVLLNLLIPGNCFGASALFAEKPLCPTEIVARTAITVLSISESALSSLFTEHPLSAVNYIAFLSDRIRFLNSRVKDFSLSGADRKTAALLLGSSDENGIADIPNLRAAAESISLSRASLYRILTDFTERKWIRREDKIIRILNQDELKGILK